MAGLPPGVTTCNVTFGSPASGFAGEEVATDLEIVPSHSIFHKATGAPLLALPIKVRAETGMPGVVALPHTDQAGFVDASGADFVGWFYKITGVWSAAGSRITFDRNVQIPSGQVSLDLDLVPKGSVTPAVSTPILPVTSFLGKTGAIEEADLADLELGGGTSIPQQATPPTDPAVGDLWLDTSV